MTTVKWKDIFLNTIAEKTCDVLSEDPIKDEHPCRRQTQGFRNTFLVRRSTPFTIRGF